MSWAYANGYRGGIEAEEGFGRGAYELGIGVHRSSRDVFDEVGFKQNRLPADVQVEEPKSVVNQFVEFVRVLIGTKNRDSRPFRTFSYSFNARTAIAVVSMWGASAVPSTIPFPAFQPPSGHARSMSISVPS
jgi:hypothetical protein